MEINKTILFRWFVSVFIILFTISQSDAQSIPNNSDYEIVGGNLTEGVLRNYLKRNISITGLVDLNPNTGNCAIKIDNGTGLPERVDGAEYNCWLAFIRNTHSKFINGMTGMWGGGDLWYYYDPKRPCNHFDQCAKTTTDIHNIDPQIICGASLDEEVGDCMRPDCIRIIIPSWVLTVYPVAMNTVDEYGNPIAVFDDGAMGCTAGHNPDIANPMTLAWYFYLGCKYIDAGFEHLRIGQINVTGFNDKKTGWDHTYNLIKNLKVYAKTHARRGFVTFDSQTKGIYHGNTNDLIFDMHSWPLSLKETYTQSTQDNGKKAKGDGLSGGYDYEAIISECTDGSASSGPGSIYGHSAGGNNPSFGYVASNPFFLEFDNAGGVVSWISGTTNPPLQNSWCHFPWSWDETTWYSQQSELQRNHFLIYAWHRIRCLDNNGYLSMLGRRGYKACLDCNNLNYRAYNSNQSCANGFNQEDAIKHVWDANDHTLPLTYSGINMKPYNQWVQNFTQQYQQDHLPDGRLVFGDFNGDDKIDILETADKAKGQWWDGWRLYLQTGIGIFALTNTGNWPAWGERFYVGDFNGDGKDDFLVTADKAQGTSWLGWNLYLSTGTDFSNTATDSWPGWGERLCIGDFNGDGRDDFIVTGDKITNPTAVMNGYKVYVSSGAGFNAPTGGSWQGGWPSWGERIFAGDFNGDQKDDLYITADKTTNPAFVWGGYKVYHANTLVSNFDHKATGYWPSWGEEVIVGDWNDDGYADITARAIYGNTWGVNWRGISTYLGNNPGNHLIYAFSDDKADMNNSKLMFRHKKTGKDQLITVNNLTLREYTPDYCDNQWIRNGAKQALPNNTNDLQLSDDIALSVYPNPSKNGLFYIHPKEDGNIIITSLQGQKLLEQRITTSTAMINLQYLPSGVYVLIIQSSKKVYQKKLIIL